MTAGIQVWNDSGYQQIDGYNQHIVLTGKGTVFGTALSHLVGSLQGCTMSVTVPAGHICAMQGQAPFAVVGRYNGQWQINMIGAGSGAWLNYWLFGPYTPSGVRFGLEIYDDNSALIYDSGRLPMRVVQEVSGLGSFGVGAPGRNYAIFPTQQYARLQRGAQQSQLDPSQKILNYLFTSGLVNVSGQAVSSQNTLIQSGASGPMSSVPLNWETDISNNQQNTVTVLDVTGY